MRTMAERMQRRFIVVGTLTIVCLVTVWWFVVSRIETAAIGSIRAALGVAIAACAGFGVYMVAEVVRLIRKSRPGSCWYCGYSLIAHLPQRNATGSTVDPVPGNEEGILCPECGQRQPPQAPHGIPMRRW